MHPDQCVSKNLGTRISGPQFFGFSDPMTVRALCAVYTPAELEACVGGGVVATAAPNNVEKCVLELRTVDGLGEQTGEGFVIYVLRYVPHQLLRLHGWAWVPVRET